MIGLRFFPLKSADVRGAGTLDEPLRTSAWEASTTQDYNISTCHVYAKADIIGLRQHLPDSLSQFELDLASGD